MSRSSKTSTAAATRERILDAALAEFGEKGYAGARMDEIAACAGANKQLLYHYFGSKDGLFEAMLHRSYHDFRGRDDLLREEIAGMEAIPALHRFVDYLFRPSPETVRFQLLVQDENRFAARHVRDLAEARDGYARLVALLKDILDRGVAEGRFRAGLDPAELYISIAGLFMFRLSNAHTLTAMLGIPLDTEEGSDRSRQAAFDLILAALRPDAGAEAPARHGMR